MTPVPAPAATGPGSAGSPTVPPAVAHVDVVVPTVGRASLPELVGLLCRALPEGSDIVVVDDRPGGRSAARRRARRRPPAGRPVGRPRPGRGPQRRMAGSHGAVGGLRRRRRRPRRGDWVRGLIRDRPRAPADVAAVQGRVEVPLPADRRPTDWERNVAGLDDAPPGSPPTWPCAVPRSRRSAGSTSASPGPTARTPTWPCGCSTRDGAWRWASGRCATRRGRRRGGSACGCSGAMPTTCCSSGCTDPAGASASIRR